MKKKVLDAYVAAFDELNVLVTASIAEEDADTEARVNRIADDMLSFLILAYKRGIEASADMLGVSISVDINRMYNVVYKAIDGKTFEDRVREHILESDYVALRILSETEYHRVYNAAVLDGGTSLDDIEIVKTWVTVGDDRVRDTHVFLEGVTIPVEERFWTIDGDSASYPGDFALASNNCGCRCMIYTSPKKSGT